MKPASKTMSTDLSMDSHRRINEIIKRTGETKVEFFERIIKNEFEKKDVNPSNSDNYLLEIKAVLEELKNNNRKQSEILNSIRDGINRIICSILFLLKELFRTMHFIKGIFLQTNLLNNEKLTIISNKVDHEATDSYLPAYKILSEYKPVEVMDLLRNKKEK